MNPESIKSLYPGQSIIEVSSPRSTLLTFMTEMKDMTVEFDNKILLELPLNESGIGSWGIQPLDGNRKTTMYLPSQIREFQRLVISIPYGYHAVNFDTDVTKKNELGRVSIRYSKKNGRYEVFRNLNISSTKIEPEQYNLLKELLNPWLDPSMRRILIEPAIR